jgi:peptidyl-prolyl cis-trans isomerase B (cyclophilin B)
MQTTMGEIVLELSDLTPIHRDNFMQLVEEHYFDSLLFHRVIENFMIQGGDPRTRDISGSEFFADGEETGDPRYWEDIPAEIHFPTLYHKRGALAAAREGDDVNPQRRSSRTQFYIVWGRTFDDQTLDAQQQRITRATGGTVVLPDSIREVYKTTGGTPHLDGQYTVFGHVVSGLDVVDRIQRTATDSLDRPVEDVRILSVKEITE